MFVNSVVDSLNARLTKRISILIISVLQPYCTVTTEYGIASDFLRTSSSECKARGPVVALTYLHKPLQTVRHRASFPVWSDCDRLRCPWTVSAVVRADTAGSAGNTGRQKCLQETASNGCTPMKSNLSVQYISQIDSGVFTIKTIKMLK